MLTKKFSLQVASDNDHNPDLSVDRSSKAFAESCHPGVTQVSSSSTGVLGEAVGISEMVDVTSVDSPEFCASAESSKEKELESKPKKLRCESESSKKPASVTKIIQNETSSFPCTIGDKGIDVFASQPKTCPFVIELFAGSGRVTAHLKHVGLKASFGVHHKQAT